MTASSELHWFKSSYSGGSGTECVECAYIGAETLIRDSKQTQGAAIRVQPGPWRMFIVALMKGALR